MSVIILYSPDFLDHDTGKNHPENSNRIITCKNALQNCEFSNQLEWVHPRSATRSELQLVHSNKYIDYIKNSYIKGNNYLDPDTPISKNSFSVAKKSAGAWITGIDKILDGNKAFVLSRPPGHHAESNKAMGFCLFSNAALSAEYALTKKNINKVAIFDWDVHHGNGTQKIIEKNSNILYSSIHQYPFYPGTGFISENNKNNILNIPIPEGYNSKQYLKKFDEKIIPFISCFKPDILIISAGFDAHYLDPLANINLYEKDFAYMTKECLKIQSKILIGLEGGYHIKALTNSCISVIKELI